jgi:hypothetical protein
MPDNWQHRSEGMRCKTCMYFVPKVAQRERFPAGDYIINHGTKEALPLHEQIRPTIYHMGRCRRHAPTLSGWPVVFVNDWCGDHKIDEGKFGGDRCPDMP